MPHRKQEIDNSIKAAKKNVLNQRETEKDKELDSKVQLLIKNSSVVRNAVNKHAPYIDGRQLKCPSCTLPISTKTHVAPHYCKGRLNMKQCFCVFIRCLQHSYV
jgi:polyribonucleotide nucleotidyltransferase